MNVQTRDRDEDYSHIDDLDITDSRVLEALKLRELGEMDHRIPREERRRVIALADGILRLHEGGGREDYRD